MESHHCVFTVIIAMLQPKSHSSCGMQAQQEQPLGEAAHGAVADGLTAVTAAGADAGAPRAVPNGLGAGDSLGAAADAIQPVLTSRQQVRSLCAHGPLSWSVSAAVVLACNL